MASTLLSNTALLATGIAMVILTTAVFSARVYLGVIKPRRITWEDGWLIAAWVVFVVVTALYLNAGGVIFRMQALQYGLIDPYPTVGEDNLELKKTFFVSTSGLWICLWLVKASLLSLYRRLMNSVRLYIILWWVVVGICVLTLVGAITTSMLSCSSMKAWFAPGPCDSQRDIRVAYISLWYSYSVDVLTDLLVMLLPLGLIRNLQMHWKRKMSIGCLFALGLVCIAVSTIRATYLGQNATEGGFQQPSTSWLALWAIVESGIAVIIGCGPGLYREAKIVSSTRRNYYRNNYNGGAYIKATSGRSDTGGARDDIRLQSYPRAAVQVNNASSSEEGLVHPAQDDKIMVTRSVLVREDNANKQ